MTTVHLTLELPDDVAKDAESLGLLDSASLTEWLEAEVERRRLEQADEAQWENHIMSDTLGDALSADGGIDFEKLHARTTLLTLDELDPESAANDER